MNRKVKALLVRRGIKQTDIARTLGLTPGTVSGTINGLRESRRVKEYIAQLLKQDFNKLWSNAA